MRTDMKTDIRIRLSAAIAGALAAAAALNILASAAAPRFFDDDPVWLERDSQDASSMQPLEVDLIVDVTTNLLAGTNIAQTSRAKNVNTVDEVPDSSWFTNRVGRRTLTPEDIAAGPNTTAGPASGPWTVTASK